MKFCHFCPPGKNPTDVDTRGRIKLLGWFEVQQMYGRKSDVSSAFSETAKQMQSDVVISVDPQVTFYKF